tara:strand:+ start:538 stop:1167 length:630 start_codon:yes stop_codon:yes gene_type:complete
MSRIRANTITNQNANGAPNFPDGITVSGVVTATTLNQTPTSIVVGSAVTANSTGINVIGIVTATSYRGDGSQLTGLTVGGASSITFNDDVPAVFGASSDFQIKHDGTYNQIRGVNNHNMYFYTNNTLRTVIQTDGHLRPAATNTYDLGTSADRWRNLYTQDLQLSNESSGGNNVDGTWGDWTLQEGENDIFMINNRSGKKFKIKMEEVS